MNQVLINVTKENIERGVSGSSKNCPVAIALKQNFPYANISVGAKTALIGGLSVQLPDEAVDFIEEVDFSSYRDYGLAPLPISFEINF